MSKETGGQAFPGPSDHMRDGSPIYDDGCGGMTLRDHFAGLAMQSLYSEICKGASESDCDAISVAEATADLSYQMADAMIAARNAKK